MKRSFPVMKLNFSVNMIMQKISRTVGESDVNIFYSNWILSLYDYSPRMIWMELNNSWSHDVKFRLNLKNVFIVICRCECHSWDLVASLIFSKTWVNSDHDLINNSPDDLGKNEHIYNSYNYRWIISDLSKTRFL